MRGKLIGLLSILLLFSYSCDFDKEKNPVESFPLNSSEISKDTVFVLYNQSETKEVRSLINSLKKEIEKMQLQASTLDQMQDSGLNSVQTYYSLRGTLKMYEINISDYVSVKSSKMYVLQNDVIMINEPNGPPDLSFIHAAFFRNDKLSFVLMSNWNDIDLRLLKSDSDHFGIIANSLTRQKNSIFGKFEYRKLQQRSKH